MYSEIDRLLNILEKNGKKYDTDKIKRSFLYAKELHEGQFRKSGEAYISHPVAVAEIVAELGLDTDSIVAAMLHDTVEDCGTKVNLDMIRRMFGEEVAMLVDGLTKLVQIPFEDKEEEHIENLRKMFLAMSKDVRVIFIKLCDRLHNMRTLSAKSEAKRRITALETMHVYAPLAHRLGMQRIKQELESLALSYLDPIGCAEVEREIERRYGATHDFLESVKKQISSKLDEEGYSFTLEGRIKSVYSIYRKMYQQNKSFDQIFDFYALRIIVADDPTSGTSDCYAVMGTIHDMFKSVPGRFKDYISTPKPNMYRSLHTTVIGRDAIPFEVQIRTREMHRIAEYGVAAHWKYKSGEESSENITDKLAWIAKLIDSEDDTRDQDEFLRSLKIDMYQDETFVFTPKGDVITLPQGATVIDFAYGIHSAIGNKMVGAKVNGMIVPIDYIPQNGEMVEILTSSTSKGPSRDWFKIVKTGEARNKIRQWFKKEMRTENIQIGRAACERELKRMNRPYTEAQKHEILSHVSRRLGISDVEDLYNTIGYGGVTLTRLIPKLKDEFDRVVKPEPEVVTADQIVTVQKPKKSHGGVVVDNVEGLGVKFAKCCNPLPGDKLIGFITKGFGVSVHKYDCPNVSRNMGDPDYADRFVAAHWENVPNSGNYEALLRVYAVNSITLLANLTAALAEMRVSLLSINTTRIGNENGEYTVDADILINLTVSCKNVEHFKSIVSRLKLVPNVKSVVRGYT